MNNMKFSTIVLLGCIPLLFSTCGGSGKADPGEPARMYGAQAAIRFTEGNLLGALAEYRKAYAAAARADLPLEQAQCMFNIGRVNYELGRFDSAGEAFSAAWGDYTYFRDTMRAAWAAGFIALVNAQSDRYDSAIVWYGRGRPENFRDNAETAFWLTVQARLCTMKDRIPEARGYLDRAMESYKKEKMYIGMAQVGYYQARIAYAAARYDEARAALASSLALLDRTPERFSRWRTLLACSAVSFCLNDRESGTRYYIRAADCAPQGIAIPPIDSVQTCPSKLWER
jgi:tetratricopeptide (TPR) repeat protein